MSPQTTKLQTMRIQMVLKHGHVDHAHMAFFEAGSFLTESCFKGLIVSLGVCQFFPKTPRDAHIYIYICIYI